MLREFDFSQVKLLPSLFKERYDKSREYLFNLNTTALLQNFYLEAGVIIPNCQVVDNPEKTILHWGWEAPTCQLRGHFLGHWLSASSMIISSQKDNELEAKLNFIIDELERCQKLNGGEWIGPIPEKYFDKLERNEYIWSPQYTMHKLIMGLTDSYRYANSNKALQILSHLADWYIKWTSKMQKVNPNAIYSGESGGMLESWALLFELTKDKRYETLMNCYKNQSVFKDLEEKKDPLSNCHANATIPLSHGAWQMYLTTGDNNWKKVTDNFWKEAVTTRGSFATTGQNAGEFWIPPYKQGSYINERDQEFCTVYNMVRTASMLYTENANTSFSDYIERALYNGFLSQQNKNTALPTYFLPLKSSSKKKWGTPTKDFWCCYGTMVQAQAIYPKLIYYTNENSFDKNSLNEIFVSQYIPSELSFKIKNDNVNIQQNIDMKYYNSDSFFDSTDNSSTSRWLLKFKINCSNKVNFNLDFRIPSWCKENPTVKLNGIQITEDEIKKFIFDGYLHINKEWNNDEISLYFPTGVNQEFLPGRKDLFAILEGPIVLAAVNTKETSLHLENESASNKLVKQSEHTYETFPWKQSCYVLRTSESEIDFMPLYDVTDESYTVYFH